jgi:hypothetical protein
MLVVAGSGAARSRAAAGSMGVGLAVGGISIPVALLGAVALGLFVFAAKLVVEAGRVATSLDERFDRYLAEKFPGEPLDAVEARCHELYERLVGPAAYVAVLVGFVAFVIVTLAATSEFLSQPIGGVVGALGVIAVAGVSAGAAFAMRAHEIELRTARRQASAAAPFAPQYMAVCPVEVEGVSASNEPVVTVVYSSPPSSRLIPLAESAACLHRVLEVVPREFVGDDVRSVSRALDSLSIAEQQMPFAPTARQIAELLDAGKIEEAALVAESTPIEAGLRTLPEEVRSIPEAARKPITARPIRHDDGGSGSRR